MDKDNRYLVLDGLFKSAMISKEKLNETKLYFGMALQFLKQVRNEEEFDPEETDTYNSMLAQLQTNERRTLDLIENYKYVAEHNIPDTDWKFLDSSIIKLCRKYKANPEKYMYMSWSDAKKELEETKKIAE
jgi:hypothetical protein